MADDVDSKRGGSEARVKSLDGVSSIQREVDRPGEIQRRSLARDEPDPEMSIEGHLESRARTSDEL